jgi:CNT family concentrative nucleoside transporter
MAVLQSSLGLALLLLLAWAIGEDRRRFPWRMALAALALQFGLAWVLLETPWLQGAFIWLNRAVTALQEATRAGTSLVFGYLGGGPLPFAESHPGASFILAFQALPLVLVISVLSALLWHWRVLPWIVGALAWGLKRSLGLGGGVSLAAAANIFVGMVEAPLLIRPLLARLPRSDLFALMTCGMATIAGTVLGLYATFLDGIVPNPVGHLLTASIISVPAAILFSRIMVPEAAGAGVAEAEAPVAAPHDSALGALVQGTQDGLALLLNITAMLIVLVALVALVNGALSLLPEVGGAPLTLERLLGLVLRPYAWALGIPWDESAVAGTLIGKKTVLNELLAYLDLAALPPEALSARSRLILTYALCGFANPGSLGIMIGGLAAMAPERRGDIVALAPRSLVAGTLATGMTGSVVGLLSLA